MGKVGKRPRGAKRERTRALEKLGTALDRLARESPGGTPERAIRVDGVAVVELRALAHRCVRCDGPLRLRDHQARFEDGEQLRQVDLLCERCHTPRTLWFVLGPPPAN